MKTKLLSLLLLTLTPLSYSNFKDPHVFDDELYQKKLVPVEIHFKNTIGEGTFFDVHYSTEPLPSPLPSAYANTKFIDGKTIKTFPINYYGIFNQNVDDDSHILHNLISISVPTKLLSPSHNSHNDTLSFTILVPKASHSNVSYLTNKVSDARIFNDHSSSDYSVAYLAASYYLPVSELDQYFYHPTNSLFCPLYKLVVEIIAIPNHNDSESDAFFTKEIQSIQSTYNHTSQPTENTSYFGSLYPYLLSSLESIVCLLGL